MHGLYETDCGHSYEFVNGFGPVENGFKACPFCGMLLREMRAKE
jgi:hypothetical protein